MPSSQSFAVVGAARLFALLAIGGPVLWLHQDEDLLALLALSCVWIYQGVTSTRRELQLSLSPSTEAAVIGILCGVALADSPVILAALVVPPLYATAVSGRRTMLRAVVVEAVAVVVVALGWSGELTPDEAIAIFTWLMAGLGLSLIAAVTFDSDRIPDPLAPYRDAQQHLRRLLDLAGDLDSGLDVGALGGELLSQVGDRLPNRGLVLYVPRGEALTPVASASDLGPSELRTCEQLAGDVRRRTGRDSAVEVGSGFALRVSEQAVVAGVRPGGPASAPESLSAVATAVADTAVKLDAALLFAQFRDAATADERSRLAREMHDGVAQDIASLGYLVDALAARPADAQQAKALGVLRERVSAVVAEVRQSVMNLRTSIGESESLGAAISNVARHLSESSGVTIRVSLDEQPTRLRPEVEAELFRIAQEAMNNAVKHSRATAIDVRCRVHAPEATITVCDDGVGLQSARADSHGMKIMRERARLVGADLDVRDNADHGLTVSVELTSPRSTPAPREDPTNVQELR